MDELQQLKEEKKRLREELRRAHSELEERERQRRLQNARTARLYFSRESWKPQE